MQVATLALLESNRVESIHVFLNIIISFASFGAGKKVEEGMLQCLCRRVSARAVHPEQAVQQFKSLVDTFNMVLCFFGGRRWSGWGVEVGVELEDYLTQGA